ncbi:MAG: hypothetical protein K2J99_08775 [Lachnospiraceae bacterium]|nr:hypothetical protein [Lachnospiraceae bacterium]
MEEFKLNTAVAFCVFNRLDKAKEVFQQIRGAKPPRLYIIADGPRADRKDEKAKVEAVRTYIEQNVDWECTVYKNYAPENMGCGRRVSSGIGWVFETEEEAIILEDDCLPTPSFFRYCQEMLEHYRDNEDILMISGNNPYSGYHSDTEPYFFTKMTFIWGWATWRRTWKQYDFDLLSLPKNRKNPVFRKTFPLFAYWVYMAEFETLYKHNYDTWDYQLLYQGVLYNKLSIIPAKNLIQNVGMGEESTHTGEAPEWVDQEVSEMTFPLSFREDIVWDQELDMKYFRYANRHGLIVKIKQMLGLDINKSIFSH